MQSTARTSFKSRYRAAPEFRFWQNVDKNGPEHPKLGQCWIWIGSVYSDSGYGQFSHPVYCRAHRFSYFLQYGDIPEGVQVLHHCDNPICVNPAHLFAGNTQLNVADKVAKNRQARGERQHLAKLTAEQVADARRRYKKRCPINGREALAKEFGVSAITMGDVLSGRTWKHV